ncbi:MAG: hypothetical protein ILNGONEN_00357 [Syntrophorhabdaceae bacterium]|jgi:outer membrane protein OmpA-like peptidoglycan-associated protein|nr:hypothetical protein [Syntrophorhabdaceae bacterium]MDI9560247.1 OmpA family protein [Pseudomonadota bacterium]
MRKPSQLLIAVAMTVPLLCSANASTSAKKVLTQTTYNYKYSIGRDAGNRHSHVICDGCTPKTDYVKAGTNYTISTQEDKATTPLVMKFSSDPDTASNKSVSTLKQNDGEMVAKNKVAVVRFGFDKHDLTDKEKSKLKSAKDKMLDKNVSIVGYTDKIGSKNYNDILAQKRAESVASCIRREGIEPSHVEGKGKCCYVSETDQSENRRVEVLVIK